MSKILIDIPNEFMCDYDNDKFRDFFERVKVASIDCCLFGKRELETVDMLKSVFAEGELYMHTIRGVLQSLNLITGFIIVKKRSGQRWPTVDETPRASDVIEKYGDCELFCSELNHEGVLTLYII